MVIEKKDEQEEIVIPDVENTLKPPEGYTADEWAALSEGEREALSLKVDDKGEIIEETAPEVPEDTLKEIAEEKEEPVIEAIKEEIKPKEKPIEVEGVVTDEELLSFRPTINESMLPDPGPEIISEEIQTKLNELDTKIDSLDVQFDAGDINKDDLKKATKAIQQERDALNRQIVLENNQRNQAIRTSARADLLWKAEQSAFFRARKDYEYGDKATPKGKALYGALNETIKSLDADPANSGLSGMALLVKADKIVKEMLGVAPAKKEAAKPAAKKDEKPPAKFPDDVTLSDVPEAKASGTDTPWSALDRLTGAAYEKALGKLTPEQLERYERAR